MILFSSLIILDIMCSNTAPRRQNKRNRRNERSCIRIFIVSDRRNCLIQIALCFDQIMTDEELIYTVDIHAPEYSAFSSEMIGTLTKVAIKKRSITGYKNVLDSPATPGIALNIITSPLQSSIFTLGRTF